MVLSVEDIASVDAAYWANLRQIKLQKGVFTFDGREYLLEPMQDKFRRKCMMKGTQGGASLIVMLIMLHGMIFKRYPQGVLYLFPTTASVQEYSKSRFSPLIQDNPSAIGRYIEDTNTAGLKKVNGGNLYLRGGNLSEKLDIGYQESTQLKAISVDATVFDEVDLMDSDTIAKAIGRMDASEVKDEIYIGNPGVPRKGIDAFFQESDQRHWWMTCVKCATETCAEKEFFDNPSFIKIRPNGTGYLGCRRCGAQISNQTGIWKPDVPANSNIMHGWRWSQLIIPYSDPAKILQKYRYPPQDNIGDVCRINLGMPYISSEDQLTHMQVLSCCGDYNQEDSSEGPCIMGVDQGDIKHLVIGIKTGRKGGREGKEETFKILRVAHVSRWEEIHDLARRFNVKLAVVDLRPNADAARDFQRDEKYKIHLCEYSESSPVGVMFNDKTGLVKVNRTEIFDASGKLFSENRILIPRKSPEISEFVRQVTDPVCIEERDKKQGGLIRRYRGKDDHYRNAINYFLLAASRITAPMAREWTRPRSRYAKNEYVRC